MEQTDQSRHHSVEISVINHLRAVTRGTKNIYQNCPTSTENRETRNNPSTGPSRCEGNAAVPETSGKTFENNSWWNDGHSKIGMFLRVTLCARTVCCCAGEASFKLRSEKAVQFYYCYSELVYRSLIIIACRRHDYHDVTYRTGDIDIHVQFD